MPISSQVPIIGYVANGVTKSFAFPFAILSADDLKVKVGADVVTAGFSIAGVGDRDGGSVTFTNAPASLTPIILYREVTLDRTTDYQENGDLLAVVLDDDLDRIWMALQDQLLLQDRALRSPLGETLQQLPPASERALMALAFDASGNPIVVRGTNDGGAALALDLLDTAPSKGSALVGFQQAGVGAKARTSRDKQREIVSLSDFNGFDDTGATSINACLSLAKARVDSFTVTPDAGGPRVRAKLVIPPGTYLLTADAELPLEVECYGQFTGAYKLKLTNVKRPNIKGLSCSMLKISGCWFGVFEDIYGNVEIDGGGVGFGTFWNTFTRVQGDIAIDLSNWSVNQNTFTGRGSFTTIGSGPNVLDGHGNNTADWDFTGGNCSNTASVQQDSLLIGTYYEAGANVEGPYHIVGFQGDANGPPKVGRRNHVLASYDVIEKNRHDFIATGANILAGGAWDVLDSSGKPPCIVSSGGALVVADTTEPFGMGVKYGGAFTTAFTGFQVTIPPCQSGRFALVLAYQGDDFTSVEVARGGGGGTTSGGESYVTIDATNNWKLMRVSGNASKTASTVVQLFALTAAGSKTIHIGGMYATQEKAAQFPAPAYIREAQGVVTQGYVAGTSVDISVTFPKAFASEPVVIPAIQDNAGLGANYTKMLLTAVSTTGFTVRIFFPSEWSGKLHWFARGVN